MYFLLIPFLFIQAKASGEFSILHFPNSLDFKGDEKLNTESLSDVLTASVGYAVQENSKWSGLTVIDPFNIPQAAITFFIDGVDNIHTKNKAKSYELVGDNSRAHESLNMLSVIAEEYDSRIVDVDLNRGPDEIQTYSDVFGDIHISGTSSKSLSNNLKPDIHFEDKLFLQQLAMINALTDKISANDKLPTFLTIRMSLEPIVLAHGENSPAYTEALKLISDAIERFSIAARKAYNDNVIFTVVTAKSEHNRSKRQAVKNEVDPSKLNLATHYSDDYPVFFNIILWFGVIMAFALLAISYTIATMDPGRDSIIYRMTSTRMKKDN